MRNDIFSVSVSDEETKETIKDAYHKYKLLLEPHGSVGWKGLMEYKSQNSLSDEQLCISLETAHPAKFPQNIIELLGFDPELPDSLKEIENKDESFENLKNNYKDFRNYLVNNYK
jgi:threonine synthase